MSSLRLIVTRLVGSTIGGKLGSRTVVFVLEPFHCVEAFEILADHVLFFSWVTSCKLYWCRVGHVFVNSKVAYE